MPRVLNSIDRSVDSNDDDDDGEFSNPLAAEKLYTPRERESDNTADPTWEQKTPKPAGEGGFSGVLGEDGRSSSAGIEIAPDEGTAKPQFPEQELYSEASMTLDEFKDTIEFEIQGKSLKLFGEKNTLRKALFHGIHNPIVESFILLCILFNTATLIFQTPGNPQGLSESSLAALDGVDLMISVIFTLEAAGRIIALGFFDGEYTYLQNPWNVLDFVLLSSTWISMMIYDGLNGAPVKPNVFRTLRALRPLRSLRFFEGLKAIVGFFPFIFNVLIFLSFFVSLFGVVGVQLFGGSLSYKCLAEGHVLQNTTNITLLGSYSLTKEWPFPTRVGSDVQYETSKVFVLTGIERPEELAEQCPSALQCKYGCTKLPFGPTHEHNNKPITYAGQDANGDNYPDGCDGYYCYRNVNFGYYGFDNIGAAALTLSGIVMQDEWPMFSHAIAGANGKQGHLVWPFFAMAVIVLAVITANLFVSVVCYAFGNAGMVDSSATISARQKKLQGLFMRIDDDNSGAIEAEEIQEIANFLKVDLSPAELNTAVEEMDSDGGGDVDFSEFCAWWRSDSPIAISLRRSMAMEDAIVKGCFEKVDDDNSGILDAEEVYELLKTLGIILSANEMEDVLNELDEDGDNEVSLEEFTTFWYTGSPIALEVRKQVQEEKGKIQRLYERLDTYVALGTLQNTGTNVGSDGLNVQELVQMPTLWGKREMDMVLARAVLKEMDLDSGNLNTRIQFTEFYAWWKSDIPNAVATRSEFMEEESRVRLIFNRVDVDGSGMLDRGELNDICVYLAITLDLDECVQEIDQDGNGDFDFAEFFEWFFSESLHAKTMREKLPVLMLREVKPTFPNIPGFSLWCRHLITSSAFDTAMMTIIVLNVVTMACEHHGMSQGTIDTLFIFEIIFAVIYVWEAIVKICGMGMVNYFRSHMNKLDFVIAACAVVGLAIQELRNVNAMRVVRVVVKILRLLRTVKLLSRYDAVVLLLRTVVGSSTLLATLTGFILFTLGILSIVAVHSVGACHAPGTGNPTFAYGTDGFPRRHFYTFGDALLSNFQIMSGAGGVDLMYLYMNCSGKLSWIYFFMVYGISNFFLLNIFVAVVLENFSLSEEEKLIKQEERYLSTAQLIAKPEHMRSAALDWVRARRIRLKETGEKFSANMVGKSLTDVMRKASVLGRLGAFRRVKRKFWNQIDITDPEWANLDDDVSLGCMGRDNGFRQFCHRFTSSHIFEGIILVVIATSCICLAIEGPPDAAYLRDRPDVTFALTVIQLVCLLIFGVECLFKVIATGFVFTPKAYIGDPWNRLDFFVLITAILDVILTAAGSSATSITRVLRLLRVLRPLRMIQRNEGMRVVVDAIISCIPTASAVVVLSFIFYISFALLGVSFFGGKFYRCSGSTTVAAKDYFKLTEAQCHSLGHDWVNPGWNFDNIFVAMRQLFLVSTCTGWIDIMHAGMDVTQIGLAPVRDETWLACLFFVVFVIVGGFFINSIFIGVLVNFFGESSGTALLTTRQKRWMQTQMVCLELPSRIPPPPAEGSPRRIFWQVVSWKYFDPIMVSLMVFNLLVLMCETTIQDKDLAFALACINNTLLGIFTFEWIARALAFDFSDHWDDRWSKFDLFVLVVSYSSLIFQGLGAMQSLRSLRVLRVTMIIKNIKSLRTLVATLFVSIPPSLNLTALMSLFLFIYGVLGMQLFGQTPYGEYINENDNFDDILHAMRYLFQIMTGQEFHYTMHELSAHDMHRTDMVFAYYGSYYVLACWIYMNLFVAVILESFEINFVGAGLELDDTHLQQYKTVFSQFSEGPDHETMQAKDLMEMVPQVCKPLSQIVDDDEHWHNRILFELRVEPEQVDREEVGFYEVLLVLCLINETYDGLSFEEMTARRLRVRSKQEHFASRILKQGARRYLALRKVPEEHAGNPSRYIAGVKTVFQMQIDCTVRRYKVLKARQRF